MGMPRSSPPAGRTAPRYAHLRTPPSISKEEAWKDTLKQSCLERARRKRAELVHQARTRQQVARTLVQESCLESGISIVSSRYQLMNVEEQGESYAITEEELYQLMQQVEAELQSSRLEEAAQEYERNEEQFEQAMVENYYEEEDVQDDAVICPICNQAFLCQQHLGGNDQSSSSTLVIACPNQMSCTCSFRIEQSPESQHDFSLSHLKERLGAVFAEHASSCSARLQFEVLENDNNGDESASFPRLRATCQECHFNLDVLER